MAMPPPDLHRAITPPVLAQPTLPPHTSCYSGETLQCWRVIKE